ncbi:MAG TPA: rhodanese-like domain-containing protein [Thermoanaerobaculia bacterium]|nr:rhodanese-like domain-containing protein [Thermoanaerobaculia bacterium]
MIRRVLLVVAIIGGVLAPFAGSPYRTHVIPSVERGTWADGDTQSLPSHPGPSLDARDDMKRLAAIVQAEEDHVTAVELAQWIRTRKPGLRVLDLRTAAEFEAYHVPSSRNLPLAELLQASLPKDDTLVLVSDGGAHAAQAWVFLQTLGYSNVYFLRGGLQEWLDDVMRPVNATPEQAELSRYFGGSPRPGTIAPTTTRETVAAIRRRGC